MEFNDKKIRIFKNYTKNYNVDVHIWVDKLSTEHGHDYYEFAICNKGEIIHNLNNDNPVRLKKKSAFFITPNDRHSIEAITGATHINISFIPELFIELCKFFQLSNKSETFKNRTILLTNDEFSSIVKQTDKVLQMAHNKDNEKLYVASLNHLVEEIFYIFLTRNNNDEKIPEWLRSFVDKVCTADYFEMQVKDLYALSNYSQPILTGMFRKYYGMSFVQYFTEAKISYACGLLKNTNLGLLEISNRIGFSSLSHFNAVFKKIVGDTPSNFRKSK